VKTKVYYADTDAGGVVYYANYLRWMEMARADWLEATGISVVDYVQRGFVFAVSHLEIQYHVPAVLGDAIEVVTTPRSVRRVRFQLTQQVYRCADQRKLATAQVTLACLTPAGKLSPLPESLVARLAADSPPPPLGGDD
jgi:acyl-CoA thioester hydrolase